MFVHVNMLSHSAIMSGTTVWECFYYLELLVKWELLTNHYKIDFSPLKFLTCSPLQKGPPTKAFLFQIPRHPYLRIYL